MTKRDYEDGEDEYGPSIPNDLVVKVCLGLVSALCLLVGIIYSQIKSDAADSLSSVREVQVSLNKTAVEVAILRRDVDALLGRERK